MFPLLLLSISRGSLAEQRQDMVIRPSKRRFVCTMVDHLSHSTQMPVGVQEKHRSCRVGGSTITSGTSTPRMAAVTSRATLLRIPPDSRKEARARPPLRLRLLHGQLAGGVQAIHVHALPLRPLRPLPPTLAGPHTRSVNGSCEWCSEAWSAGPTWMWSRLAPVAGDRCGRASAG